MYVIDTHALIWYLRRDSKLGPNARQIFTAAEQNQALLVVSAIVIAEMYYANAKSRWVADFSILYQDVISKPFFRYVAVNHTHITDFTRDQNVPEMHDRIIVGLARRLGVALISMDSQIIKAGLVPLVW